MKGQKTGGRRKGTPNKASVERQSEVAASGLTPLEFMLTTLRNADTDAHARMDAAKAAAPYVHPKLATIQVTNASLGDMSDDELRTLLDTLRAFKAAAR